MSTASTDLERVDPDAPPAAPAFMPVQATMDSDTMSMLWREAKALAAGRMFKNVQQAEQAFSKLVVGHHLGLHPAQSMTGIDIVEGNPQFRGTLLGTLVRGREGYDWKVTEHTETKCSIEFFRGEESEGVSTFTLADAERAGLIEGFEVNEDGTLKELKAKKDNWRKYPKNMLWNRAMSNGVKQLVPETMSGIPVYVEGELDDVGRQVDGGNDRPALAEATDPEALKEAILEHIPDKQLRPAFDLIREMNGLAPNSWTASKVEMLFKGKEEKDVVRELAAIRKSIEELRARKAQAEAVGAAPEKPEEEEEVADAEVVDEAADTSDSSASDEEAKPAPEAAAATPEQEDTVRRARVAELEEALADGELSEQQRGDAEAELDVLTAGPPEVSDDQDELPL